MADGDASAKSKDALEGFDEVERLNYEALKKSNKKWTDAEALHLATNPSGRLHKWPGDEDKEKASASDKRYGKK